MAGTTKGWHPRNADGDLRKHPCDGTEFIRRNRTTEATLAAIRLLACPGIGVLAEITVLS